jgi:hypothetical protein
MCLWRWNLLFRSCDKQCSQWSNMFRSQTTPAFVLLGMSLCGLLCRFGEFTRRKWEMILSRCIYHCILCGLCSWVRCWMLQDVDHLEACCVLYVKVGMFDDPKQNTICDLTIMSLGIVMLTLQDDPIVTVCFIYDPGDILKQTSPDFLSIN